MDPPSYDEATLQPSLGPSTIIVPHNHSYHPALPSVAPPPYEATTVIVQPNPFPVLSLPASPTSQVIVHQPTVEDGFRQQWTKQMQRTRDRWTPTSTSLLCSDHFTDDCFEGSPSQEAFGLKVNSRRHIDVRQTVVVSQPQQVQVIAVGGLLDTPGRVRCSHCQHTVTTRIKRSPGVSAYVYCVIIALTGLICGFCLIPFMFPSLWVYDHYCPLCNAHLHTYHLH
ncbi:uncharacterized protein si:dkeyp-75b4.8 [Dunckerocampus dactyliophorus]|uniref:uncharacterized protein si:dkeyp-75b4.8 n=1 Tax=Dunckerocampus dactyliophorus TaxID=161453 RepID=UPI0024060061|nr:uncharacterized protein si:dkeyp-75b4.8 [Dunckerocampus dactyliophorus]